MPGNVTVGERCWCYSAFAFLHHRAERADAVRVGHDTGIYNGTFFDLGPDAQVIIGNYCTLVGAIIATNGRVEIGDYSFLAHEVVLADHFAMTPEHAPPGWQKPESIVLGANVWIGARAVILAGATIGENAIIGAGAVVDGIVPPNSVAAGNPLRIRERS
jgi:acetyltransferase-like isoleucine patch superfamily enzyme